MCGGFAVPNGRKKVEGTLVLALIVSNALALCWGLYYRMLAEELREDAEYYKMEMEDRNA